MTGESLGELYIDLDLKKGTFDRKVDMSKRKISALDGAASRLSRTMIGLGAVAVAATGAALVGITKNAITLGSELEEMDSKFQAVFKNQADDVEAWATAFSGSVGRSEMELKGFLSTFQDTFVPLGFSRKEGAEMSKTLTRLAVDMASFNNKSEPETIAALQSALVGNHETMRQYGVIITQATLDQELLNMGIEGGVRAATEQEKVLARLNIIMSGTSDAQGDAERTAGSFANQMRTLKGNFTDMMAEAGREELPELTEVLIDFDTWGKSGGYDNIQSFFGDVADGASLAAKGVSGLVQTFGDMYGVMKWEELETPDGMSLSGYDPTATTSGSVGMLPSGDLMNISGARITQESEITDEINAQNDALTEQQQILSGINSDIPDWAGHSDYIQSRLDEVGGQNIGDIWSPETGNKTVGDGVQAEPANMEVNNDNHFEITVNIDRVETSDMSGFSGEVSDGLQQAISSAGFSTIKAGGRT